MGDNANVESKAGKVDWYKQVLLPAGRFILFIGFIGSVVSLFTEPGMFLNGFVFLESIIGLGVFLFAYGLALARERRWHIFGLLNFVFFGSFVLGLFSMIGREPYIGFYIWAIGGVISLALILILVVYWGKLLNG